MDNDIWLANFFHLHSSGYNLMHYKIKMVFCRCNIQGSVVSANVHINEKCELKDCIVGAEQNLQANSEYSFCFLLL